MLMCDYTRMVCGNFGCDQEIDKKDWKEHEKSCEYAIKRCEKCEVVIPKDSTEPHDCITALKNKFDLLESKILKLNQKQTDFEEKALIKKGDVTQGMRLVRKDIPLVGLNQIKFQPHLGYQQQLSTDILGLPLTTKMILLKFTLTDINLRR